MESKVVSPSVVAKLMGLDELPQQQPGQKRRRVLSENYFGRVASIGAREKCYSVRLAVDHNSYNDVCEDVSPLTGDDHSKRSVDMGNTYSGLSELKMEARQEEFQVSSPIIDYEYVSLPGELGFYGSHKFSTSFLESNGKGCSIRNNRTAVLKPKNGKADQFVSYNASDESYTVREATKSLSQQGKMTRKSKDYGRADKGIILGNLLSKTTNETDLRKLDDKLGRHYRPRKKPVTHDLKDLDLSKFRKDQDKYETLCSKWSFRRKRSVNWAQSWSSEFKLNQRDSSSPLKLRASDKKYQHFSSLELGGNSKVVHNDLKNGLEEKHSDATDTSVREETSLELDEESTSSLQCFTTSDCTASLEEVYQPSPVSVLEPLFTGNNSPSPERVGLINLVTSECSDTYSEGSGIVSSDDDTNGGFMSDYKDNNPMGLIEVEESRDFSYLIDVLLEAGYYSRGLEVDSEIWCFEECPMSLCVFDSLEKKFADQVSWNRSDRRLLFDRINDRIVEVLQPCIGRTKPISRRIKSQPGQEMVEEDLWRLLVAQEKKGMEARKNLEEKLQRSEIGRLDLGDDTESIGIEVERFLFDELVEEFVSNLAQRV